MAQGTILKMHRPRPGENKGWAELQVLGPGVGLQGPVEPSVHWGGPRNFVRMSIIKTM